MRIFVCFILMLGMVNLGISQTQNLFREIKWSVPQDLTKQTLLVPKYEEVFLDEEEQAQVKTDKSFREQVEQFNRLSNRCNEFIDKTMKKHYNGKYMMVKFSEIAAYKAKGCRYYLDCVVMPKQFHEPIKEAMAANFEVFANANLAFTVNSEQFHFYFYLRDLQTNDIYLSKKFEGKVNLYDAMADFLKRLD